LGTTWVIQGGAISYTTLRETFTGLTAKTIYSWKLRAWNARGFTDSEVAYFKAAGQPEEITTLAAEYEANTAGPNSVALSWVAPDMHDGIVIGYKVFRNNGDGGPVSDYADPTCGMDSRPAPQRCTISGLQRGRTYSFQIAAINEIGESKRSMEQQFRAAAVPAKIGTLRNPSASTVPALRFEWDAPNDRGAYVYNYEGELERLTNAGVVVATPVLNTWTTLTRGSDTTDTFVEFSGTGYLAQGEQYRFRVRGYNAVGPAAGSDWGWSDWSSTTPSALGDMPAGWTLDKPEPPTAFGRAVQGLPSGDPVATAITVGWKGYPVDPDTNLGGDVVANCYYEVYAGLSPTSMVSRGTVPGKQLADGYPDVGQTHYFTFPDLVPGTHVYFQVYTWNRAWRSVAAVTPYVDLIAAAKPDPPDITSVTSTAANSVDIVWTPPANDGGAPILEYDVAYGVSGDAATSTIQLEPGLTSTAWNMGYTAGTTENFWIRARSNAGYSDWDGYTFTT